MNFNTERLYIRPVSIDDKKAMFGYRSDADTNKYQGWIPKTIQDVEVFIGKVADTLNIPETWFQFVIIEQESNTLIGDIGIHFSDEESRQVEIGCTLNKDYQGKGYATEALREVIDYMVSVLNKHRITTSIDPLNDSSIRLVSRLGFRKEAHFIESLFLNGAWVDDLVYALLAKEWIQIKK